MQTGIVWWNWEGWATWTDHKSAAIPRQAVVTALRLRLVRPGLALPWRFHQFRRILSLSAAVYTDSVKRTIVDNDNSCTLSVLPAGWHLLLLLLLARRRLPERPRSSEHWRPRSSRSRRRHCSTAFIHAVRGSSFS